MTDRERLVAAVLDVLAPVHPEFGKRMPIFEWGHETTPTLTEVTKLAEDIVAALFDGGNADADL